MRDKAKNLEKRNDAGRNLGVFLLFVLLSGGLAMVPSSSALGKSAAGNQSDTEQQTFDTPKDAAKALIQATRTFDVPALERILGPHGKDVISSGDAVRDKNLSEAFAERARQEFHVTPDPQKPDRAILSVGPDDWPLPIPIVKKQGKWLFDSEAGRQEILFRRIGENELDAIQVCRGYVEAQQEYAMEAHDGVNQYAQKIISTPGKQDGLAWRNPDGTWGGPVGEAIAEVLAEGYTDRSQPYHGYFFKILKGQGPDAPLGRMNFLVQGAMIGGFALVAAPAQYRVSGVKTFQVGFRGIVYQKDLGPNTLSIFKNMQLYNPDATWTPTDDNW